MDSAPTSRDKRDTFRIDEDLHFEFRPVTSSDVEHTLISEAFEDNDDSLRLINQLSRLDKDASQSLKILTDKNRLLGDYLNTLNAKIDTLARHIAFNSEQSLRNRPKTRISLSEDGIGFICNRSFYKDSFLAVRLIFLPNYAMAEAYAQVVRCVQKEDKYQVAARFHQIYDKDRQIISRQVLKAQVRDRRKKQDSTV